MSARAHGIARRHVGRFAIVGLLSVATDAVTYLVLARAGASWDVAKGLGYGVGMVVGFLLNKTWTFASRRPPGLEGFTYVLLYALTMGVNVALNRLVLVAGAARLGPICGPLLAFLAATGVTTVLNFLGMRFITFRRGIAEQAAPR